MVCNFFNSTFCEGKKKCTLWFQSEDMFQLIVMPKGIEKVTIHLKDTPTKVNTIGAKLFYQSSP